MIRAICCLTFVNLDSLRPMRMSEWPLLANSFAYSRPMPSVAPVITTQSPYFFLKFRDQIRDQRWTRKPEEEVNGQQVNGQQVDGKQTNGKQTNGKQTNGQRFRHKLHMSAMIDDSPERMVVKRLSPVLTDQMIPNSVMVSMKIFRLGWMSRAIWKMNPMVAQYWPRTVRWRRRSVNGTSFTFSIDISHSRKSFFWRAWNHNLGIETRENKSSFFLFGSLESQSWYWNKREQVFFLSFGEPGITILVLKQERTSLVTLTLMLSGAEIRMSGLIFFLFLSQSQFLNPRMLKLHLTPFDTCF